MKMHFLHIAKFVALVALAVVITHTLGSRAQGSHEHARPAVRVAEHKLQLVDAGGTLSISISGDRVNIQSVTGIAGESDPCNVEPTQPSTAGDDAVPIIAASADGGIISSLASELKSTITLLRAYSQWIRTSPESMS